MRILKELNNSWLNERQERNLKWGVGHLAQQTRSSFGWGELGKSFVDNWELYWVYKVNKSGKWEKYKGTDKLVGKFLELW